MERRGKVDLRDIQEIASNQEVYLRGTQYFHEKKVEQMERTIDGRYTATVRGEKDTYRVVVDIGLHESIGYYSCSCQAFRNWYGACKHIVAVLLQIRQERTEDARRKQAEKEWTLLHSQQAKGLPNKQIQEQVRQLIQQTVAKNVDRVQKRMDQNVGKFTLFPTVHITEGVFYISFAVGCTRLYKVKNISAFCQQVRTGAPAYYGKQKAIVHRLEDFEPQAAALVQMVLEKEKEFRLFKRSQQKDFSEEMMEVGREMLLTPGMFDRLFKIFDGEVICFRDEKNSKRNVEILLQKSAQIRIQLQTAPNEQTAFLKAKSGKILHGDNGDYFLQDNCLLRMEQEPSGTLEKLLQLIDQNPEGLPVTEADMKDLEANVLRPLQPLVSLQVPEALQKKYCAPPFQSRLYLDQKADGQITGRLCFLYGTQQFSAFDSSVFFPGRDFVQEEQHKRWLFQYFSRIDLHRQEAVLETDDDVFYRLLTEGIKQLGRHMEIYTSDRFRKIKVHSVPKIQVSIHLENHWMDLAVHTDDVSLEEWKQIIQAYRVRKKYFRLRNGDFLKLEESQIETAADFFKEIPLKAGASEEKIRLPQTRALFFEKILEAHPEIQCQKSENFKQFVQRIQQAKESNYPIPVSLSNVLRDYQKSGYQWLRTMQEYGLGGILADDMGLGKTLQIIALLLAEKQQTQEEKHTFIVCPASLVYNWQAEIRKFAPELTTLAIIGNSTERQKKIRRVFSFDIAITSYDLLRRDLVYYQDFLFDYHIIDEAQYIKNHNTHNARSVCQIRSRQRFALTGTPIENHVAELWSVFDFLMPQYLYSYAQFKERFEKPIVKEGDTRALHRLNQMIAPFLLRRMKKDVLEELPEKTETVLPAEMEPEQRKLYRANVMLMRRDFQEQLKQRGLASSKFMLLSILMRLRQLCCHPRLYYEDYRGGSGKLELCMEIVRNSVEAGHKILLFSQFTSMLAVIGERLKKENISFYCLEGATPKETRMQMVERFQNDSVPVFLISLRAGGTGLNLTAADIVIHYDPWWNSSAQNQATDRVHRIGQKNRVQVYQLITKDSIEEKILYLQRKKQELADSIIGVGSILSSMTAEEILELFEEEI